MPDAMPDEQCQIRLGSKNYFLQAADGALAAPDGSRFQLAYWDNNRIEVVKDAKITVVKSSQFHEETVAGISGVGSPWMNNVVDYATRIEVETASTEIEPAMMGRPAVKQIAVSTMCTSITRK